MTERELLQLKEKADAAKEESLKLQGQKTALLKQLKEEFGCKNIEEAKKKITSLEKEKESVEKEMLHLEEEIEKLLEND